MSAPQRVAIEAMLRNLTPPDSEIHYVYMLSGRVKRGKKQWNIICGDCSSEKEKLNKIILVSLTLRVRVV